MRDSLSGISVATKILCLAIAGAGIVGCTSDPTDPRRYPYQFEELLSFGGRATPVDFDRDGLHELAVFLKRTPADPERYTVVEVDRTVRGPYNVDGEAQNWLPELVDRVNSGYSLALSHSCDPTHCSSSSCDPCAGERMRSESFS